jgi:inhibitor of cysteine peptidase
MAGDPSGWGPNERDKAGGGASEERRRGNSMYARSALIRWGIPGILILLIVSIAVARLATDSTGAANDEPGNGFVTAPVTVETIDVLLLESFPVQVMVQVQGYLPDPCYETQDPVIERDGNRFVVEIIGKRETDAVCAQVIQPYEESINLGPVDPGDYTVEVNGVVKEFRVD